MQMVYYTHPLGFDTVDTLVSTFEHEGVNYVIIPRATDAYDTDPPFRILRADECVIN